MPLITTNDELNAFCAAAQSSPYLTVDTEFLRERTYFAELCVLQLAYEGEDDESSAVIDVLANGLDLAPVLELFRDENIVKVFHAARQDLEILYHDYAVLPAPFFDTQIAAMVAGYGEQVGYETLVKSLTDGQVDKSSRFTDWRRRPLTDKQIEYARGDVTHLREVYKKLHDQLTANGRLAWVQEELDAMLDPALYEADPREAWRRVRTRTSSRTFLAYVRELAEFRESYARTKNVPKTRVFKDDALLEAAAQKPKSVEALSKLRVWPGNARKGEIATGAIAAIERAAALDPEDHPKAESKPDTGRAKESLIDLLKVYLKAQSERHNVAMRLICSSSELEAFAADPSGDHALTRGWRGEVFGNAAMDLIAGRAALAPKGRYVEMITL